MGADAHLTCDAFLGERLRLWQPKAGYRAGIDPVLLAASVPATPGQSVLDVGCGVGTAMFCLAARVPGLRVTGLELQPEYAELAKRNARQNNLTASVVQGDLSDIPRALKSSQFDHVITNPPYYVSTAASQAKDSGNQTARAEHMPMRDWLSYASKRLAPRGYLTVIQRADRLVDVMASLPRSVGGVVLLPIVPRAGRDAALILVQARQGAKSGARLAAPVIVHQNEQHFADEKDYSPQLDAILRHGAALPI